mgnify:CR=1 FL=1
MKPLVIKDSQIGGETSFEEYLVPHYMVAVEKLKKQFEAGLVDCVRLTSYHNAPMDEPPVWYGDTHIREMGTGRPIISRCTFYSSHYVGTFHDDGTTIIIRPRFGGSVFGYLAQYATNLYLPEGQADFDLYKSHPSWLIVLVWKAMLNKALTNSHTPKQYVIESKNLRHFRGKLAIRQHLHINLIDQSRFYCTYHRLSMDNTINRTIRYTLNILNRTHNLSSLIQEFNGYDEKLESFGVSNAAVTVRDIESINYNKMTAPYADVMNISKLIIQNHDGQNSNNANRPNGLSYFLDVAELWEMYLLKLLQNNLLEYNVYSPNAGNGEFLLDGNSRSIRPDILIEKDGKIVMIIDAKYKRYSRIGQSAAVAGSVSREDLYQMSTYLYHYANRGDRIAGIFVSPDSEEYNDCHTCMGNTSHEIGVINLHIKDGASIQELRMEEGRFIRKIKDKLSRKNNHDNS